MAIQVVYVAPTLVDASGQAINKDTASFNDVIANKATEMRIVPDPDYANTANSPTIKAYLKLEDTAGRKVAFMSNTLIVTQT